MKKISLIGQLLLFNLFIKIAYAQGGPPIRTPNADNPLFGKVTTPYGSGYGSDFGAIIIFFTNILRLIFIVAGLFALIKIVIAGFGFISAGGEPKKIEQAWSNIWQSLIGLLIIVSSFVLAAIIGQLFFGDINFILKPTLYGVGP